MKFFGKRIKFFIGSDEFDIKLMGKRQIRGIIDTELFGGGELYGRQNKV